MKMVKKGIVTTTARLSRRLKMSLYMKLSSWGNHMAGKQLRHHPRLDMEQCSRTLQLVRGMCAARVPTGKIQADGILILHG